MFQPIRGHVSNLGFKIGVTINILESQLTYLNHPQGNISAKSGEVNWSEKQADNVLEIKRSWICP